jgi:DNA-binding winged helix-turn-helix (wHTH) protein/tetratricopeptide (TPR) repeat protein/TolB-like protein
MTAPTSSERRRLRFDAFVVDLSRRQLLRDGRPVQITPKALAILLVLLEKPGEVVEKEDLIGRVWPDTFVTEANLTQNISSLRKALGERAGDHRFIVTLPGKGYCFVAPVVPVEPDPPPAPAPTPAPPSPRPARDESGERPVFRPVSGEHRIPPAVRAAPSGEHRVVVVPAPAPPAPAPGPRAAWSRRRRIAVGLAALVLAGAVALRLERQRLGSLPGLPRAFGAPGVQWAVGKGAASSPPATVSLRRRPSIAVLDLENLSGRSDAQWMGTALIEMLSTELSAGTRVRVVSRESVARAREALDFGRLDAEKLVRLHDILGSDLAVVGSYLPLRNPGADRVRVDLRVLALPSGDIVATVGEVGARTELFELVGRMGARLRDGLGFTASPEQVRAARALQPSSPDAARLYAEGLERLRAFDPPGAVQRLTRAAMLDPGSALIRSGLSRALFGAGYEKRAAEEAAKAMELARGLPRETRLDIEGRFYVASQQWSKVSEVYGSLWTFFPDNLDYGLQLATGQMMEGHPAQALETVAVLHRLPPPTGLDPRIDLLEARIARRISDSAAQMRAAETAADKGRRLGETVLVAQALVFQGGALEATGRRDEALARYVEAEAMGRRSGDLWAVGMALANRGTTLQNLGRLEEAEQAQKAALAIARKLGSANGTAAQLYNVGNVQRERGDLVAARRLLEEGHATYVQIGDRMMEARALQAAAAAAAAQGDLAAALSGFERVVVLGRETGDRIDEGRALDQIGFILAARGRLAEARRYHERAFTLLHALGSASYEADALAGTADVLVRQGDLATARRRYDRVLVLRRRSGDRIGLGQALGARADLAGWTGDLAVARSLAGQQIGLADQTGARWLRSWALETLGRAALAAGDLAAAGPLLREALDIGSAQGEEPRVAAVRLDLARLALAAGRPAEAEPLARQVEEWARARGFAGIETEALAVLVEALLRQGRLADAQAAADVLRARLESSEDVVLRLEVTPWLARATFAGSAGSAEGERAKALDELRRAADEASRLGFAAAALEARLALGQLLYGTEDREAGRRLLDEVRREALRRGLGDLARRAGEAGRLPAPPVVATPMRS